MLFELGAECATQRALVTGLTSAKPHVINAAQAWFPTWLQSAKPGLKYSRGTNNAGRGFKARLGPPPSGKLFPNLAPTLPPRRGRLLPFLFKASRKDEAAGSSGSSNGKGIS